MTDLRLADLLAALSQVTDLGMGQPPDFAIRTCLLATGLARCMNLPERDVADVYYTAMLQHIGCTAYAHETAAMVNGDDLGFRAEGAKADDANLRETLAFMLTGVAKESSPPARIRAVFNLLRAGPSFPERLYRSNCEVAVRTAERLGLPRGVQRGLGTIYARPDGKGLPITQGDEIAVPEGMRRSPGRPSSSTILAGRTSPSRRSEGARAPPSTPTSLTHSSGTVHRCSPKSTPAIHSMPCSMPSLSRAYAFQRRISRARRRRSPM